MLTDEQFLRKFQHGTFERFLGTETIEGCDCEPCEAAYRFRITARKSFSYYRPAKAKA